MNEPDSEQSPSTTYASINVLVVDDNPANREAFDSVIRPLGYSVFLADSGKKALELADRHLFSVILLDVRMPMMSGLETARELRKKPFSRSTPIVLVSAYEETQIEVSRAGLEGMIDFIFSPVNPEVLTWKVQTWVEVGIRQDLLRRQAARISEAQGALHEILEKTPTLQPQAKQAESRLAAAVRAFENVLAERQGIAV